MRLSQKSIVTVVVLGCFVALSPMKAFAQEVIVTPEVLAPIIQSSPTPEVSEPKAPLIETALTPQVAETPAVASTPVPVVVLDIAPIQTPTLITEPTPIQDSEEEITSLRSHDSDLLKDFTGVVRQAKPYYCGPAALATVFEQMGKDVDQEKIADISVMDEEKGTTLYGLEQATKAFGFIPVAKKWDIETLKQYLEDTEAPIIIHDIKSGEGHFTVVREITEAGIVELSDTEAGNIAVDVKTFEHAWTGYVLIVMDEIDHPLLADESTNVSDAVAKTIWGTYVLVAIGDDFSDSELRNLHYCIMKAEKKSDSKKQKEAKRKCYKDAGAGIVDKSEVAVLERYGFSGLSRKQEDGTPILITSEEANTLLHSILDEDDSLDSLRDDINDLKDSINSKKKVLKKVDDKLDDMEGQLIRLDQDYKVTKSKLKKASAKKQKELKKDLDKIEDKQDRLEAQIAKEKKRIAGEVSRLNKEFKQLESSLAKKEKQLDGKKSSIRNSVARLKSLYDVENTDVVIYNDEKEKYDGYTEKLSFAARVLEVASIVSPISIFDLCAARTGKDCVNNEDLSGFDEVLVGGALIPYGGKLFKATKVVKNGKRVLEVVEVGMKTIAVSSSRMEHVINRHTINGIDSAGKSIFFEGENIEKLIKKAENAISTKQNGGNYERIIEADRNIGMDVSTGNTTKIYTVITDSENNLVTVFPGRP